MKSDAGVPQKCPTCSSNHRRWRAPVAITSVECRNPWHDAGVPSSPKPKKEHGNVRCESTGKNILQAPNDLDRDLGSVPRIFTGNRNTSGGEYLGKIPPNSDSLTGAPPKPSPQPRMMVSYPGLPSDEPHEESPDCRGQGCIPLDRLKACRNPNHALTDGSPSPHEIGPSCMAESVGTPLEKELIEALRRILNAVPHSLCWDAEAWALAEAVLAKATEGK